MSAQGPVARAPMPRLRTIGSLLRSTCIFFVFFLAFGGDKASAQHSNVTCLSSFDWSLNTQGRTPCKVASELQAECASGRWDITPLPTGYRYIGPTTGQASYCICDSVTYQLMSACGACQNETWITYLEWSTNCGNITTLVEGEYQPSLIPPGTLVPRWAYIKPSDFAGTFNLYAAKSAGDTPESSRVPSITSSLGPRPPPGRHSNAGAIAGGVVGGVLGFALIAVFAAWVLRGPGGSRDKGEKPLPMRPMGPATNPNEQPALAYQNPFPVHHQDQYPDPPQYSGYPTPRALSPMKAA
ncbi:uncharacterized protein EI90DRAFT_1858604 [Cantharellus anzutake]|uniref:uncharacterized protein n=1 Tax=Cantharellus anzutake TaxID=1750568 RepID=UPI0019052398|nr:uncharacterized protein EI90DRAFT_1858604 [Cantharellus anzutake]KAF8327027.1 hypothetical protein EI90DRAFT_1858604 [Cantharellus anzutake]